MKLSIIAPCFNEELVIEKFYKAITQEFHDDFELIIVNDGSVDHSREILDRISSEDKRVKVIHFAANRGHQIALFAGIEHSSGDIVVTMDIDLQDPPSVIHEMIGKINEGYDVIHTVRKNRGKENIFKRIFSLFFYKLLNRISEIEIIENCGDFRAFTKKVKNTVVQFKEEHLFLRGLFVHVGYRQYQLSYDRVDRVDGKTKYTWVKMIELALNAILSFSSFPLKSIMVTSFFMWSLSLLYLAKALVSYFLYNSTIRGWTSLITLQIFFTGLILFALSIIGSYIGRSYEQTKKRPMYWVDSFQNLDRDEK